MGLRDTIDRATSGDDLVITRSHMAWLHSGRSYTPEAVERVLEVMRKDMLTEARSQARGRIRASMLGDPCARKQQLSFHGAQGEGPKHTLRTIFDIGTFSHYRWQLAGLSAGWLTDIEVPAITEYGAGGSLDGKMFNGLPFEFKTANGASYRKVVKSGPLTQNVFQVHAYMDATDTDAAHIVYEDKSWDGSFLECVVRRDEKIIAKLRQLAEMIHGEELAPFVSCTMRDGKLFQDCAFTQACRPWEWRS